MQLTPAYPDVPPAPRIPMDSLWGKIRRHLAFAIVCAVLAASATLLGFAQVRPLYQAEATLVMDRAARPLNDDDGSKQIDYGFLNTQRDLLLSDAVLGPALVATGSLAREPYADAAEPAAILRHRVSMIVSKDSWIITVSLRDESAAVARNLLALVLHSYSHHEIDLRQNRSRGDLEFLTHQVDKERELLTAARAREQDFRASHGILTADTDRSPLASQLESCSVRHVELEHELDGDRVVIGQMAGCDAIADAGRRTQALLEIAEIKQDPAVAKHRESLAALQDRAVQLGQKYKAKHPRMLEITGQLAAEQAQLAQAIGIARSALENRARALTRQSEDMAGEISRLQAALTGYRGDLMAMGALSEERSTHERLFAGLLTRLRQSEIDNRLVPAQLMTIDAPHAGSEPVNIHWPLFAMATAITAAIAAIMAALIADVVDRRIPDAEMASALTSLEVIGNIPHVSALEALGMRFDPRNLRGRSAANRMLDECFNALRVNVRLGEEIDSARVLMIASSMPGDGRSTIAARLGHSLAASGVHVLLIDGDLRRGTLHRQVGEHAAPGLSEWLHGDERARPIPTACTGLDIMTSGSQGGSGHLQGRRLRQLIDLLRPSYDCIILDSPPIQASADALVEATVADSILLVIRGRHTTREHLAFAHNRLSWLRHKLLGIAFNDDRSDLANMDPAPAPAPAPAPVPSAHASPAALRSPVIPQVAAAGSGQRAGV